MSEVKIHCSFVTYPNAVRQSLRNLQRREYLSRPLQVKMKDDIKKVYFAIGYWFRIFYCAFANPSTM